MLEILKRQKGAALQGEALWSARPSPRFSTGGGVRFEGRGGAFDSILNVTDLEKRQQGAALQGEALWSARPCPRFFQVALAARWQSGATLQKILQA